MPDWDQVYADKSVEESKPAEVLLNNSYLLPAMGEALDYASGLGGNAVMLARMGFDVIAHDLSSVAIEKLNAYAKREKLPLNAECLDLELEPPQYEQKFDVIVVSYFLHRKTLPKLYGYLRKGGLLFYQTFSGKQFNQQGPSNPDFRLSRNELLHVFSDMELLFYREDPDGLNDEGLHPDGRFPGQVQFVARK